MKRKHLFLWIGLTACLMSACDQRKSTINFSGTLEGVTSDTILLYTTNITNNHWLSIDTLALHNGYFETTIQDTSILLEIRLTAKRGVNEKGGQYLSNSLFFYPGDHMTVKGEMPFGLMASGTTLYDKLAQYTTYTQKTRAIGSLEKKLFDSETDTDEEDALLAAIDTLEAQLYPMKMQMIEENTHHVMAGYLSLELPADMGVRAIGLIADDVKKGVMAPYIDEAEKEYRHELKVQEARRAIAPGRKAPTFTLPDLDNKNRSLEEFKGKYVVLDFWGTWCGWCIAGIPKMKAYYEKYHEKIEFIGICSLDTEKNWRKAVRKHQLPWVNVLETEGNDLSMTYGIAAFPTKIIIDPEGNIMEIFEGEDEEFYDRLDDLCS